MNRYALLLIPFLLLLPSLAAAEQKVGYVNVNYLIDESPQAREADAQLEASLTPAQRELQGKQEEFEALQEELEREGLVMGESEREELQQRLQALQQELMQGEQVFRQQLEQQRNIALGQVEQAVIAAVDEIAAEEGYDLVVSRGILYVTDEVDLTERVLDRMRRHYDEMDD